MASKAPKLSAIRPLSRTDRDPGPTRTEEVAVNHVITVTVLFTTCRCPWNQSRPIMVYKRSHDIETGNSYLVFLTSFSKISQKLISLYLVSSKQYWVESTVETELKRPAEKVAKGWLPFDVRRIRWREDHSTNATFAKFEISLGKICVIGSGRSLDCKLTPNRSMASRADQLTGQKT